MNVMTYIRPEAGDATALRARLASMPRWKQATAFGTPVVLFAAAALLLDSAPSPAADPPSPTVTVAVPLERRLKQWDEYVGRFEASRSVEVRPRVSGQVMAVHFTDGAMVRQGQLLFTIDPRPFAAALAEARASVATAQSELGLARTDLGRARRLLAEEAVSQSEVDRLAARVSSAVAALAAAQARVRSRSLDVEFASVRAPIGGKISDRRIDPGNLVATGETLLTTINALDPIYFTFDVPESLFLKTARQRQAGEAAGQAAEIRLQDEAAYNWKGRLDFTDNGISRTSGTMRARAVVPNPNYFLSPGMFGNMRLADGGMVGALLVPDSAVRTDQARKVLLVVGEDDMVVAKPIQTGPMVGPLRVVRSGIARSDRVVVSGVQFATPGTKVKPRLIQLSERKARAPGSTSFSSPAASQATLAN